VFETRLLVRHDDGGWAGYTYAWNGADAQLVTGGEDRTVAGQEWRFPSGGQCLECHTNAAGRTLGLEVAQLNGAHDYPSTGRRANQLATLDHIGLIDLGGKAPDDLDRISDPFGDGDVDPRARAWLHTNCAFCHRPDGTGGGTMDLRWTTDLADMAICDEPPERGDLGIADARIVAPGDASRSVLWSRIARRDAYGMPPLATHEVDGEGVALIGEWIGSLSCP
jgi:mono/diheme cytochrome c family protein